MCPGGAGGRQSRRGIEIAWSEAGFGDIIIIYVEGLLEIHDKLWGPWLQLKSDAVVAQSIACILDFHVDNRGWSWILFYVPSDDDNDDKIDRNPHLHFKDKGSFTSRTT